MKLPLLVATLSLLPGSAWAEDPPPVSAEGELPPAEPTQTPPPPTPPPPPPGAQVFASLMNPSISLNGLFLGSVQWADGRVAAPHLGGEAGEAAFAQAGESFGSGLNVQEVELQLMASVDPYFKAVVVLAVPGLEGVELEEGYVTLTTIPRVLLSVGKIKAPFGRENPTHTHGYLTIDKSLIGQRVFGGEGLNDVGIHASLLLPTPWYSEISLGVDRGTHEIVLGSGKPEGLGLMGRWKNLIELSYEASLEIGASALTGPNAFGGRSVVAGADLTLKAHGRGHHQWNRVVWQTEYLFMRRPGAPEDAMIGGLYSTIQISPTRRFWVGGRFDAVGLPAPVEGERTFAASGLVVFAPTEFSAIRVQYQHQWVAGGHTVDSLVAQLNFTIGAHPAHVY